MEIMPKRHDSRPEVNARVAVERTTKRKEPLDRLTRDSIAAEQAGMSYGQYKALHPHTPDEDETPPKPKPKTDAGRYEYTCTVCGKTFYTNTKKTVKYCGYDCSKEAARLRYEARRDMKQEENESD